MKIVYIKEALSQKEGEFILPLFNIFEDNGDTTSLYINGDISYNNMLVENNQSVYLKDIPLFIIREWELNIITNKVELWEIQLKPIIRQLQLKRNI